MIRVLFVTGTVPPNPCGVGDYTSKLAQSLAVTGKIKTAILTSVSQSNYSAGAEIPIFPMLHSWKIGQIKKLLRMLEDWQPDIVHVQYPTQGYGKGLLPCLIPLVAKLRGTKSVQTWHEGFGLRQAIKLTVQSLAGSRIVTVRSNFLDRVHPILRGIVKRANPILIENASAIPKATCSDAELFSAKRQFLNGQKRLIVFFGFLYPQKGVEQLFEIADPLSDRIVIAGTGESDSPYISELKRVAAGARWAGKVTFTGFMPPGDAAILLRAADAVILPFREGGGPWNTSVHSAILNEAFVITTSFEAGGYDRANNVYSAKPDDLEDMRLALARYCGSETSPSKVIARSDSNWTVIAQKHCEIYTELQLPFEGCKSC